MHSSSSAMHNAIKITLQDAFGKSTAQELFSLPHWHVYINKMTCQDELLLRQFQITRPSSTISLEEYKSILIFLEHIYFLNSVLSQTNRWFSVVVLA